MTNPSSPASEGAASRQRPRARAPPPRPGTGAAAVAISYHFRSPPLDRHGRARLDDLGHVLVAGPDCAGLSSGAHRSSSAGENSMIQFVSQVWPPSAENACSQRGSAVIDLRPDEAHADRPALERVGALEHPDAVGERADDGRIEAAAAAAVGPVDRPQARSWGRRSGTTCRSCRRRDRCGTRPRCPSRRAAAARRARPRTPPTRRSRPDAGAGAGCARSSGRTGSRSRAPCPIACITSCIALSSRLVVSPNASGNRGRIRPSICA